MKFEPIDYEMIIALNIKRLFVMIEDTEEGITFEQLMKKEDSEQNDYYYWNSTDEFWDPGYYEICPKRKYYILTMD